MAGLDDLVFGDGIEGRSLLVIGADDGHYCLEARRRGARSAVGIDIEPDFQSWEPDESFDVVLCLDALKDFVDPIHALHRIGRIAREKVVLEVSLAAGDQDRAAISLVRSQPKRRRGAGTPRVSFGEARKAFLFTPKAITALLHEQSLAFGPLTTVTSPSGEKLWIAATKRRIAHLTVIAGPTAAGKSYLIRRLGESDALRGRFGIPELSIVTDERHARKELPGGALDHVVLHYNILRPLDPGITTYARDPIASLFGCAEQLTFATVRATGEELRARIDDRTGRRDRPFYPALRALYADASLLERWYDRWLAFVAGFEARTTGNYVVASDGEYAAASPFAPA
jgi:hypothetical protein